MRQAPRRSFMALRLPWLLALLLGAALLGWWRWGVRTNGQRSESTVSDSRREQVADSQTPPRVDQPESPRAAGANEAPGQDSLNEVRRSGASGSIRRQVVDRAGEPIPGAWVSWTPETSNPPRRSLERQHHQVLGRSLHARTNTEGEFELSVTPPTPGQLGTLWVTHEGYSPVWHRLQDARDLPSRIELSALGPLRVLVVDAEGLPVPGAELVTFLTDQPTTPEGFELPPAVHEAFVRTATTDEQGRALLPPGLAEQHVIARSGDLVSAPFYGRAPAEARLSVGEWSWVEGTVRVLGQVDLGRGLFVSTAAWTPTTWRTLGRASVNEQGAFGPVVVPRQADAELKLRLEGPGVLPFERVIPFPPTGSTTSIELEAHPALEVPVRVIDDGGAAVYMADVRAWWTEDGAWIQSHTRTDKDGMALLSIRPGEILVQCQRPGYADLMLPPQVIEARPSDPLVVRMDRAGRFRGRVVRGGEPVATFLLRYWSIDGPGSGSQLEQDRADGAFLVEGAPLGELKVHVYQDGWPPSARYAIRMTPGVEEELLIEMPPRHAGRGELVDASTGKALSQGTIRTWVMDGTRLFEPTGNEAFVAEDGRFEISSLGPGPNMLVIDVPGYAQVKRMVQVDGETPVEMGRIGLVREGDLTVRLHAPPGVDPTRCRVRIGGTNADEAQYFDAGGLARFPGLASGRVQATVTLPDGVRVREAAIFPGGSSGVLDVVVESAEESGLEVIVEGLEGTEGRPFIHSATQLGPDQRRERIVDLEAGRARVSGPFGEAVWIDVYDGTSILMARHLTHADLASGRVVLQLENERSLVRVSDRGGDPLQSAEVAITVVPDSGWGAFGTTDRSGHVELALPPGRTWLAQVRLADGGGVADLEVPRRRSGEDVIDLVLDLPARLTLRYMDRGEPLQGVRGFLFGPSGIRSLAVQGSDLEGRAPTGPIGVGSYHLEVTEQGLWPIFEPLEVRSGVHERTIDLRRLGGLAIRANLPGGIAVPGVAAALRSVDFEVDVADWIAAGKLPAPAGGLVTDERGELRIGGLPNGAYRYTLVAPDGRVASGEVDVPPHAEGRAVVTFAPQ